jgi:predicted RNA-binding Zn-ribbon protein involved in translation (DUF1610 family)
VHGCPEAGGLLTRSGETHMMCMKKEQSTGPEGTQRKARICLSCRGTFDSAWVGERVCPRCKGTATWRSASSRKYAA